MSNVSDRNKWKNKQNTAESRRRTVLIGPVTAPIKEKNKSTALYNRGCTSPRSSELTARQRIMRKPISNKSGAAKYITVLAKLGSAFENPTYSTTTNLSRSNWSGRCNHSLQMAADK